MSTILVGILAFVAVICVGAAVMTDKAARRQRLREALKHIVPVGELGVSQGTPQAAGLLERLGKIISSGKQSSGLRQRFVRCGCHDKNAASIFLGTKMALLAVGSIGFLLLLGPTALTFSVKVLLILVGVSMLFFAPDLALYMRIRKRSRKMHRNLPDVVDLLEICVSSGMALDTAWNLVSDEIRPVDIDLADEMALTNLEVHLGASRVDAMRHMAERTGASELRSLVGVLIQSERFGTSIADALQTFASDMRSARSAQAEESSEKMMVKLLFPMILFVFPAIFVVLVGPASIRLYELVAAG